MKKLEIVALKLTLVMYAKYETRNTHSESSVGYARTMSTKEHSEQGSIFLILKSLYLTHVNNLIIILNSLNY